jgi:hypothetical protein
MDKIDPVGVVRCRLCDTLPVLSANCFFIRLIDGTRYLPVEMEAIIA